VEPEHARLPTTHSLEDTIHTITYLVIKLLSRTWK